MANYNVEKQSENINVNYNITNKEGRNIGSVNVRINNGSFDPEKVMKAIEDAINGSKK